MYRPTAEAPAVTRPISLAPLTVVELGPDEMVDCAARAGFDGVGLRLIRATEAEPLRPTVGMTPLIRETRRRLDDTGLALIDIEVLRLKPQTRIRRDFAAFLETGAYLGASQILVTGNDPDHLRLTDHLAELADLAADYGLTPNLEPMPWTDVVNLQQGAAIVERCGHPNVGLLVDALHYDRAMNTPADLAALPTEWIRYVQICDGVAERPTSVEALRDQGRTARLFPGAGNIDLVAMLGALPQGVPVSVEAPVLWQAPAIERSRAALRGAREVLDLASDRRHLA
ncbi:sugar phosphate isomerase/epimerase family protein [Mycolicibacterium chlorophenolicum]|uniref:Xylose isomerase-like TIM barrel n=1 Tax=Mycolicibacterium chlorophenolicum TaxID=37916 RepID=A0A0J6ZFR5_9MYCO|nr:sugar phosphate isomerase/epimerase family protein [Mycolicibacterium chlorophenolicum]KMO83636.1 Xylose isomerase-like TIM barrel [Mycolicibacterium chlorophenolicum]